MEIGRIRYIKRLSVIILLVTVIGFAAYYWFSNAPKRALEKQIIAMQGMQINMNFKEALCLYNGKDSSYFSTPNKKLIVFVDSTSCSSCFLGKLVEYFEVNDTLQSKLAQIVVVLHPQNIHQDEVTNQLHKEKFPFWCIVDSKGEFIKNNPDIPDNKLLQTFTIDDKDKIILVGDPTRNHRIKELLYKTI